MPCTIEQNRLGFPSDGTQPALSGSYSSAAGIELSSQDLQFEGAWVLPAVTGVCGDRGHFCLVQLAGHLRCSPDAAWWGHFP